MEQFNKDDIPRLLEKYEAKAGDIVAVYNYFTGGSALISKLIRRMNKVKYKGKKYKTKINHVGRLFLLKSGVAVVREAHINGVEVTPFEYVLRAIEKGKVTKLHVRRLVISPQHMADLWNRYSLAHGKAYDKRMIALYYIWIRFLCKKGKLYKRHNKKKVTCNELWLETGDGIDPHVFLDYSKMPEECFIDACGLPSAIIHDARGFTYSDEYSTG